MSWKNIVYNIFFFTCEDFWFRHKQTTRKEGSAEGRKEERKGKGREGRKEERKGSAEGRKIVNSVKRSDRIFSFFFQY